MTTDQQLIEALNQTIQAKDALIALLQEQLAALKALQTPALAPSQPFYPSSPGQPYSPANPGPYPVMPTYPWYGTVGNPIPPNTVISGIGACEETGCICKDVSIVSNLQN